MSDDVCCCGLCAIDTCDVCGGPVAFVDADGEAWCRACFDNWQQRFWESVHERMLAQWHGGDDWQGGEAYRRQMREAGR